MKKYRAWRDGQEIAQNIRMADTFIKRLKGLLFEESLEEEQGLLITPCNQVHTLGMKFPIDVVYLTKEGEVIHTQSAVAPNAVGPCIRSCSRVLELKEGTVRKKRIAMGQRIAFDPFGNI